MAPEAQTVNTNELATTRYGAWFGLTLTNTQEPATKHQWQTVAINVPGTPSLNLSAKLYQPPRTEFLTYDAISLGNLQEDGEG